MTVKGGVLNALFTPPGAYQYYIFVLNALSTPPGAYQYYIFTRLG